MNLLNVFAIFENTGICLKLWFVIFENFKDMPKDLYRPSINLMFLYISTLDISANVVI